MPDLQNATHLHEDDLELYARGRLEPGHTITLESHLSVCAECRERLSQAVGLRLMFRPCGKENERSEPRFSAGDQAVIQELNPLSLDRQKVRIVDVSRHGLGILSSKAMLPGTIVRVRITKTVELGEVRHCNQTADNEYRIGLRLNSGQ